MKYFLALVVAFLLMNTSATVYAQKSKVKTVSAKKFERKMQRHNVVVLDVRTEEEFEQGHIKDAQLIDVNKEDFPQKIQTLHKEKTYLVYCRSGKRSEKALNILNKAGFEKAYHLKGGYLEWQKRKD